MIADALALIFLVIAGFHFYWAIQGLAPDSPVHPQIDGKPVFVASRFASFVVGTIFIAGTALVEMRSGRLTTGISVRTLNLLLSITSILFMLRAIGEFRLVGFFKREKSSRFAELDSRYFSPLCLLISIGTALLALR